MLIARIGCFETNSSMTNPCVIIVDSEYNKWKKGEVWAGMYSNAGYEKAYMQPGFIDPIVDETRLKQFFDKFPCYLKTFNNFLNFIGESNNSDKVGLFNYFLDNIKEVECEDWFDTQGLYLIKSFDLWEGWLVLGLEHFRISVQDEGRIIKEHVFLKEYGNT